VGDSIPAATAADFEPLMIAAYGETQLRWQDMAFTVGLRLDRFDSQYMPGGGISTAKMGVSPRLAISTVLKGATVVVSYGRFVQAPDYQYLVDAAFDDTVRTGRFRAGNPSLGHESATQYEFSLRARPKPGLALRLNVYVKRLEGLVASVPFGFEPESTIFGNIDYGDVRGFEVLFEREFSSGLGFRINGTLQSATATATNAFQLFRRIRIAPSTNDTIYPAQVDFPLDYDRRLGLTSVFFSTLRDNILKVGNADLLGGLQASAIFRLATGLPYSRTNAAGDTLIGLPNSDRLPAQAQLDALLRRPFRVGGMHGTMYLDMRNLTNRRNIVALRRDTGTPGLGTAGANIEAQNAYALHPEPIPYESPRYRPSADTNQDGLIVGAELLTMYQRAAQDYFQPLFAYGPPRLVRLGFEVIF
jgi:outer membrane receptor protein involved in Fe transport